MIISFSRVMSLYMLSVDLVLSYKSRDEDDHRNEEILREGNEETRIWGEDEWGKTIKKSSLVLVFLLVKSRGLAFVRSCLVLSSLRQLCLSRELVTPPQLSVAPPLTAAVSAELMQRKWCFTRFSRSLSHAIVRAIIAGMKTWGRGLRKLRHRNE